MRKLTGLLFVIVAIVAIYLKWMGIKENKVALKEIEKGQQELSQQLAETMSDVHEVQPSVTNPRGILLKEGVLLHTIKSDNVGLSPEGGGIGPGAIMFDDQGRMIIVDRLRDRVTTLNEKGEIVTLAEISSENILKGAGVDSDGELFLLTGNDKLTISKINREGEKSVVASEIFSDIMNGHIVHLKDDATYLIGLTKTIVVDQEGKSSTLYGAPSWDGKESFDIELDDTGAPVVTFRDQKGAPLKTEKEVGHYGNVRQLQPFKNGYLVVYESDPLESEFHLNNPFYTVQIRDASGRVLQEANVPKKGTHSVDFPIAVDQQGQIIQMVADENEVKIESYSF